MIGATVVFMLILFVASGLVIATRRQPVAVGSGVVSIKRKGRTMTQGETVTIGRASLDAVIRERDNAVAQVVAMKAAQGAIVSKDQHDQIVAAVRGQFDHLLSEQDRELSEKNARITALHAEVVRLQKMLAINDPSLEKVTIHRKEYDRLRDVEGMLSEIRQIVSD